MSGFRKNIASKVVSISHSNSASRTKRRASLLLMISRRVIKSPTITRNNSKNPSGGKTYLSQLTASTVLITGVTVVKCLKIKSFSRGLRCRSLTKGRGKSRKWRLM